MLSTSLNTATTSSTRTAGTSPSTMPIQERRGTHFRILPPTPSAQKLSNQHAPVVGAQAAQSEEQVSKQPQVSFHLQSLRHAPLTGEGIQMLGLDEVPEHDDEGDESDAAGEREEAANEARRLRELNDDVVIHVPEQKTAPTEDELLADLLHEAASADAAEAAQVPATTNSTDVVIDIAPKPGKKSCWSKDHTLGSPTEDMNCTERVSLAMQKLKWGLAAGVSVGVREGVMQQVAGLLQGLPWMVTTRFLLYVAAGSSPAAAGVVSALMLGNGARVLYGSHQEMRALTKEMEAAGMLRCCGRGSAAAREMIAVLPIAVAAFSVAYAGGRAEDAVMAAEQMNRVVSRLGVSELRDFLSQELFKGVLPAVKLKEARANAVKSVMAALLRAGVGMALEYGKGQLGSAVGGSAGGRRPFQMPLGGDVFEFLLKESMQETIVATASSVGAFAGGFTSHTLSGIVAAVSGCKMEVKTGNLRKVCTNISVLAKGYEARKLAWRRDALHHDWARKLCGMGSDLAYGLVAGESVHDLHVATGLTYLRGALKFIMEFRALIADQINELHAATETHESAKRARAALPFDDVAAIAKADAQVQKTGASLRAIEASLEKIKEAEPDVDKIEQRIELGDMFEFLGSTDGPELEEILVDHNRSTSSFQVGPAMTRASSSQDVQGPGSAFSSVPDMAQDPFASTSNIPGHWGSSSSSSSFASLPGAASSTNLSGVGPTMSSSSSSSSLPVPPQPSEAEELANAHIQLLQQQQDARSAPRGETEGETKGSRSLRGRE